MFYIVRHGRTDQNQARLLQGRSDFPLNEIGVRQAQELGDWFRERRICFDTVYSSPLCRAVQTAELIVGRAAPISTDPRLLEMDYGPYEGMDLTDPTPEVLAFFSDFVHVPAPVDMEALSDVTARMGDFLEAHRQESKSQSILISTHAIAMKGALEYCSPCSDGSFWAKHIANCAVYQIDVTENGFAVPIPLLE